MSHQNHQSRNAGQTSENFTGRTNQESSSSRSAKSALDKAQEVGTDAASSITSQVKSLLDDKVNDGADIVGHVASSAHSAAQNLDKNSPQLAGLVRGVADRLDGYASDLRDQSIDQLVSAASDYTRRQPAIVFGLAALAGFFALRTIRSTPQQVRSHNSRLPQAGGLYGS
ncbi:MAG: hypothetical protein ACXW6V_20285 [Candidatus Binatia bacterium]